MKKMILGFFDNYKAPVLFTALLLISFFAEAQIYQKPTVDASADKRRKVDSTLLFPTGCGAPWSLSALDISQKHAAQYYDSCNKKFYLYNPKLNFWDTLHIGTTSSLTSFATDQFNWKTITFPANSFTDSTLVNQLSNTATRFNNGLILTSTESAISTSSTLAAWNYGFVINCPSSQRIIFQVLDSSDYVNVGIGIKAAQYSGLRHSLNYITANIGDSATSYLYNSGGGIGVTTSTTGILINKFDYVEIQTNFFADSVVVYYHNITNGTAAKVTRPVYGYSTTSYVSTLGYPTIFIARGHVRLISYAIARQEQEYLFLGNSITTGYRANTIDSGFVGLLRNYTNAKITNGARSATASIDYTKVKEELNFRNKVVFLSGIFGNDGAYTLDSTTTYTYYSALVDRLRANNNKIVHITNPYRSTFNPPGGWAYLLAENDWIRRTYAGTDSIVSIDSLLYATMVTDMPDGLHPSQSGHIKIAQAIYQTVPSLFERYKLLNLTSGVTSVAQSFTGGLISVGGSPITSSGTLALTVAGTSGGIPYFSSGSTWASSAALTANALLIGGGAGVAPSSTTTGTGVLTALGTNVGGAGAFVTFNGAGGTPSSMTGTNITGTATAFNINGTVGATTPNTGAFTTLSATGQFTNSANGAASTPAGRFTGTWLRSSAQAVGQFVINESGATALSTLSASGTGLVINSASTSGDALNILTNNSSKFSISNNAKPTVFTSTGMMMDNGGVSFAGYAPSANQFDFGNPWTFSWGSVTTTALDVTKWVGTQNTTSGTNYFNRFNYTFSPSSGTGVGVIVGVTPTINQTGGANGITRGIYVNPTLTAAADWRSIDIANNSGFGLYQSGSSATNYFAGNVGIGTTSPATSALVDITSTTKGFLPPRMTATQGSAISSPAEGLIIYVTNTNGTFTAKGWWGYDGAAWQKLNN